MEARGAGKLGGNGRSNAAGNLSARDGRGLRRALLVAVAGAIALGFAHDSGVRPELGGGLLGRWIAKVLEHPVRGGCALGLLALALALPRRSDPGGEP